MKKTLMMALAAVLVFGAVACTSKPAATPTPTATIEATATPEPTPTPSPTPVPTPEPGSQSKSFLDTLKTGQYYLKFKMSMEVQGTTIEVPAEAAVQNDMRCTSMTVVGLKVRYLYKEKKVYVINDTQSSYTVMTEDQYKQAKGNDTNAEVDYASLTFKGSGTGEVKGKTLPYEEFKGANDVLARYYFEDGKVKFMSTISEGVEVIMEVVELRADNIPQDMFEVPSTYTKTK